MKISRGLEQSQTAVAANLYWDAFGTKLNAVLGPKELGLTFINRVLDPTHCISCVATNGELLGVAGFKTSKSAFVGGTFADMCQVYGYFGAVWRSGLITVLERDTENKRFLMDGIFVSLHARGQGVGSALLDAIVEEAQARGYAEVRLDVVDTNPRAQKLYKNKGFSTIKTTNIGPLRYIFKFRSVKTMTKPTDLNINPSAAQTLT